MVTNSRFLFRGVSPLAIAVIVLLFCPAKPVCWAATPVLRAEQLPTEEYLWSIPLWDTCGTLVVPSRMMQLVLLSDKTVYHKFPTQSGVHAWSLPRDRQRVTVYDPAYAWAPTRFTVTFSPREIRKMLVYSVEPDTVPDFSDPRIRLVRTGAWDDLAYGQLDGRLLCADFPGDTMTLLLSEGWHEMSFFSHGGSWSSRTWVSAAGAPVEMVRMDSTAVRARAGVQMAIVEVTSDPPGALIVMDHCLLGTTPRTLRRVPEGKHRLVLLTDGYYPHLTEFFVEPSGGGDDSGLLILSLKTVELVPDHGTLTLLSSPSGADVKLDGKSLGTTPIQSRSVSAGRHELSLSAFPQFHRLDTTIIVDFDAHVRLDLSLNPRYGTVVINSVPKGAMVLVNEQDTLGLTPWGPKTMPAGVYSVRLRLSPTHSDRRFTMTVRADSTFSTTELLESDYGYLSISSAPPKASLWLTGPSIVNKPIKGTKETKPLITPIKRQRVLSGLYRITVKLNQHDMWTDTVWVAPRADLPRHVPLKRQVGKLEIISDPPGANVTLDGKRLREITPLVIEYPTGEYAVTVKKRGFRTYKRQVSVLNNQQVTIRPALDRK